MRETIDISLNGIAFKAEYDAYEILKDYFDRLRSACSVEGDEGKEIADDIEARASELILSRQSSIDAPVDSECARWVIEQLGGIDQIPLSDNRTKDYYDAPGRNDNIGDIPKRFYRSKEGSRMGGIFSGLGLYFNVDPSILRLSFAILMLAMLFMIRYAGFFSGIFFFSILIYIMAWILVPVAVTPRQKLELEGQPVTPDTVRMSFRKGRSGGEDRTDGVMARSLYVLGKVIMFMVYAVVIVISVGLAVNIIGVLAGGYGVMAYFYDALSVFVDTPVYLLATIAIMSAAAPLGLLFYLFVSVLTGKPMRSYIVVPLIVIWVVCWVAFAIFATKERMRYIRDVEVETAFSLAQPSGDTLYVRPIVDPDVSYEYWDGNGVPVFTDVYGRVCDSEDYSLTIKRRSHGHSQSEAVKLAEQLDLDIFQRGDTVFVDYGQYYTQPGSFRSQKARIVIEVPKGKQVLADNRFRLRNLSYGGGSYALVRHSDDKERPSRQEIEVSAAEVDEVHPEQGTQTREVIVVAD